MDFNDTPDEAAFRSEVSQWLMQNAPEFTITADTKEQEFVAKAKAWQAKKAEAGYAGIRLPKDVGGRAGSEMESILFDTEEGKYELPLGPVVGIGQSMAIPVIRKHGTEDQLKRFAEPTLKGDITWCQLFSEPAAGSDLAGLRTKAVKDGDEWVVNGQKVWSSWAHHADWGILLARTDPTVAKHKGLTFFLIDMKSPGIDIRPIRQISGESDFNETFMTDVRIPDKYRIGEVGEGWACAMTVLTSERLSSAELKESESVDYLIELAAQTPGDRGTALDNDCVRERLAYWYSLEQGQKNFHLRMLTKLSQGSGPGAEASLLKLVYAQRLQQSAGFGMEIQGLSGLATSPSDHAAEEMQKTYIWSTAMRVAGGADEVLLNQIAERVLGMPGEMRGDKNIPFNELA
ncbi:MAG: acyl-CoA dehydrogenase [Cellvibrionaceae bacterium]|nr:acyl-CoA dehydrogenase [Cellvibrionaceae bacterium]|tara:strand:- start:70626 stop:71834 length:1209 start_codon:yes stop_codon:yes gene_type:complete